MLGMAGISWYDVSSSRRSPRSEKITMKATSRTTVNLLFLALGVVALAFLVEQVGLGRLIAQLRQVGWAFAIVLLIELSSNAASCRGWLHTFPRDDRPGYLRLLATGLASLSVAGILPSGQAGELAKGNLLRGHARPATIVSSLLFFNYLHMLTTCVVVLAGAALGLSSGRFTKQAAGWTLGIGLVVMLGTLGFGALLRLEALEHIVGWARKLPFRRLRPSENAWAGARTIDNALRRFHRADLARSAFWLTIGRLFQVVEVYVVLRALGLPDELPEVGMVYSATSLANYLLMILPAREGFLEGSSYVVFGLLGLSAAGGLSFEVVRRLRKVVYQLLGLLLMTAMTKPADRSPRAPDALYNGAPRQRAT